MTAPCNYYLSYCSVRYMGLGAACLEASVGIKCCGLDVRQQSSLYLVWRAI